MGRYKVTPISQAVRNGKFASSVSISSGQGIGSHARIISFTPEFSTRRKALLHASEQGVKWISDCNRQA